MSLILPNKKNDRIGWNIFWRSLLSWCLELFIQVNPAHYGFGQYGFYWRIFWIPFRSCIKSQSVDFVNYGTIMVSEYRAVFACISILQRNRLISRENAYPSTFEHYSFKNYFTTFCIALSHNYLQRGSCNSTKIKRTI